MRVAACVGDAGMLTYKRSRRGDAEIDRAAVHVLAHSGQEHRVRDFTPYGYDERQLCSGPGKLCAALGISVSDSGLDLLAGGALRIFRRRGKRPRIDVSPRIGVDYAGEAAGWPLRFFDLDSPAVSGRKAISCR